MPVYIVTGKLGSGKSVAGVSKALEYLQSGKPVATNIDLQPEKVLPVTSRYRLIRLPDFPSADDLWSLQSGNDTTDEEKNGLLLLDEGAFLLNARNWGEKGRERIIEWFLMSRKFGWDVMILIQSGAALDKQVRESIGEHHVVCRRLDRIKVPIVSSLFEAVGMKGTFPKIFVASVRYGMGAHAPVVDHWWTVGAGIFAAFPTKQIYQRDTDNAVPAHCILDAFSLHGRYLTEWQLMKSKFIGYIVLSSTLAVGVGWLTRGMVNARSAPPSLAEKSEIIGYVSGPTGMAIALKSGDSFNSSVYGFQKGLVYAERGNVRYFEVPRSADGGSSAK
jgi:Zonular occludens toxin (Zot)